MIKTAKYLLTGVVLYSFQAYAQTGFVKGTVKEKASNETLPGAIVTIDKTKGTASDINGQFILQTNEGGHVLECDLVGYAKFSKKIEVKANDTLFITVELGDGNQLLDEVVVSAGKFEQKLSDVTVSMEVIKPSLASNRNDRSLESVINQVPGVTVADGQASIRGGSGYTYGAGSRVLMLVDEMPLLSADAGDIKWNFLPLENMEQVEVIKGASSALFGSSALNGVINLRTAYAKDKPQSSVSMFYATFDAPKRNSLKWWKGTSQTQRGVNFSHAEKMGNLDFVMGGHMYDDDGFRLFDTEKRARFNVNLRYNFKKIQGLSIGLNTNMMKTSGGLFFLWQNADSAYIPSGRTIQNYANQRINIDPFITYFTKRGGKYSFRNRYYLTNNANDKSQSSRSEIYYSELQYQKRFQNNLTMTYGAVYTEQQVIADSILGRHTGKNYAGYAQFDYKYKKLTASMGLRGERNQVDTSYTRGYISKSVNNLPFQPVFRTGLNYHLFEYTFLRASYGQGYRFPSIAEKYVSTSVSALKVFPNLSLQPERGWSAEFGIKQGFKVSNFKGFLDLSYFWTEFQNMTEFVFDIYGTRTGNFLSDLGNIGFKSQNVGRARINGIDASVAGTGKLGPITLTMLMGYTYTNPIDPDFNPITDTLGSDPNSNLLKYRNKHLFKNDMQFEYKKWALGFSNRYLSFMQNIDRRFVEPLFKEYGQNDIYILYGLKEYREKNNHGNWVHDARISYQLSKALKASFIVNNVFNEEYSSRPGDVRPPRMFMMQLLLKV